MNPLLRSQAMARMTRMRAMRRSMRVRPMQRSRHGAARGSVSMATHMSRSTHAMKPCDVSGALDVPLGSARAAIIIVAWLKTTMFRIKTMFGDRVRARTFAGQSTELLIRCSALNHMTYLGMPESYTM